jgi:DNA-binding transcriptional ArsR family regulator
MTDAVNVVDTQPLPVRHVSDVQTMRALSDPIRLAILRSLMRDAYLHPPVRSVKELAAELGEPPTKLYRHVKQLEACQLIEVAETRLVSGIVEHRYRSGQLSLRLDSGLLDSGVDPSEILAVDLASVEGFCNDYVAAIAAGEVRYDRSADDSQSRLNPVVTVAAGKLPLDRAVELRERVASLISSYVTNEDDADTGVAVRVLTAFYSTTS